MSDPAPIVRRSGEIPFSWSARRVARFEACPRGYFLHYYAARGGHDENADPELRQLHLLKSLLPQTVYRHELLIGELRRAFYAADGDLPEANDPAAAIRGAVIRRFTRERRGMLLGAFLSDHRQPMIAELYGAPDDWQELLARLDAGLRELLTRPGLSATIARLFAVAPLRRVRLPRPLPVQLNDLTLYGAPALAWRDGARLHIAEFGAERHEKSDEQLFLHKYYALLELKIPPERVSSWQWNQVSGELEIMPDAGLQVSAVIDRIVADAERLTAPVRPDGSLVESDFPPRRENCECCNFRTYCEKKL